MGRIAMAIAMIMMTACGSDDGSDGVAAVVEEPEAATEAERDDCDEARDLYNDARERLDESPDNFVL